MELEKWLKIYEEISSDFNFIPEKDQKSAELMHRLGKDKLLDSHVLEETIRGKRVSVVGGAVKNEIDAEIIITAGKAILKWKNISRRIPEVHVTDMEEPDEVLLWLEKKGTILVLHAHGDNMDRVKSVVPKLGKFVGTTQNVPFNKIFNFGGFTDGDRAALIAKRFSAREICLHGFEFSAEGVKGKKLQWAKAILEMEGII